jgi:hypothetical protein
MKQQPVVTHQYMILQETEKTWQILTRPIHRHVMFTKVCQEEIFCRHKILTKVCLKHNCLIIQESKFNELCGLQKTVVSRAIFAAYRATIVVTLTLLASGHRVIFL